jgi:exopolysaccharide biosynthesis operon protein EpsL
MSHKKLSYLRWLRCVVPSLFALPTLLLPPAIARASTPVFRPLGGFSASYDANVLGLSGPEAALASTGTRDMSDTAHHVFAGVLVRKELSRQTLSANLLANRTRFERLSQLDYDGYELGTDWAWRLGNDWDGKLGYSRALTLAPYTHFHAPERNVFTTERRLASARWQLAPAWQARAGFTAYSVAYDLPAQSLFDRKEDQLELGLDHLGRDGNVVGLQWRQANGRLPRQLAPQTRQYRQSQLEIKARWALTGKTRFDLVAGRVARVHRAQAERDVHEYNGRMTLHLAATEKSTLSGAVWRETGMSDDAATAYSSNLGASLSGRWKASEKLLVEAIIRRERRDFTRSRPFAALPDYRDVLETAQLSLNYAAARRVNVQLLVFEGSKTASSGFGEYTRHGASLSMRYQY